MLSGRHSTSIDVHVRINLDSGDFQTGRLEEETGTGSFRISSDLEQRNNTYQ